MQDLKVSLVQANQVWEDKLANLSNYSKLIENIKETDLIILPEMFHTAFSMNAEEFAETMDDSIGINWLKDKSLEKNAAILIKDSEARKQLVVVALELLKDKTKQLEISKALKQLEKPNATLEIVDVCESIVERKRKRKSKVEN